MREARSLPCFQLSTLSAGRTALTVLLALTLGVLGGCAGTRGQTEPRTPGNFIDDEAIETLAIREIRKSDPGLKRAHLSAVSFNGILLLLGQSAETTGTGCRNQNSQSTHYSQRN